MKYFLTAIMLATFLHSAILVAPETAMQHIFGTTSSISKKNLLLSLSEAQEVSKLAKIKLDTKLYRVYYAKKGKDVIGYGLMITKKIRTKTATMLYAFNHSGSLQSVEVIAFHEPKEYSPSKTWLSQFDSAVNYDSLYTGKGVSGITGATLSARKITDAARLAYAIYNVKLKATH